jgi:soluble lytic murein transglycosylase
VFSASRLQHVQAHRSKAAEARHHKHTSTRHANRQARERHDQRHRAAHAVVPSAPLPIEISASLPPDLAAVKQAIELVRQRRPREATALATSIRDQLMQKLVEWVLLRQPESEVGFERYAAFIRTNPDWPSIPLFRRRAEAKLSQERRDGVSARRLLGEEPTSSMDRTSRKPEVHAAQETMARASPARAQAYRPQ